MDNKHWVCIEIPFNKDAKKIWKALTYPHLTEKYMYNCQLHSDWKVGGDAVWKEKKKDGSYTVHVRSKVLEYLPYKSIRFSIFHKDEKYESCESELKFTISENSSGAVLKIEQGDFSKIPKGFKLYDDTLAGWNYVKADLIKTIENL